MLFNNLQDLIFKEQIFTLNEAFEKFHRWNGQSSLVLQQHYYNISWYGHNILLMAAVNKCQEVLPVHTFP
jgi:hypothetical protein